MSKSVRLRADDIRAIYLLVGECRALGDDAVGWRQHFLAGLARLTGAGFGLAAEICGCLQGPRRDLGTAVWGWDNGFNLKAWFDMLETFKEDAFSNSLMNKYIARMPEVIGTCLGRPELIADRDWYSSQYFQDLHRLVGADATLACFQRVRGAEDTYVEVFLSRAIGERDFSRHGRAVVQEATAAIAPLVGGCLARFVEPSPTALPPRLRQVLRCLLEGDADKQIATRLALSRYTINEYVERIFRHFGVESRAELLARWIRRGWGGQFSWAVPDEQHAAAGKVAVADGGRRRP